MSAHRSYRKESRIDWGTSQVEPLSRDQINTGCMLRIADAIDKVAQNHDELVRERDSARESRDFLRRENARLERRVAALRGVITRMKRAAQERLP